MSTATPDALITDALAIAGGDDSRTRLVATDVVAIVATDPFQASHSLRGTIEKSAGCSDPGSLAASGRNPSLRSNDFFNTIGT